MSIRCHSTVIYDTYLINNRNIKLVDSIDIVIEIRSLHIEDFHIHPAFLIFITNQSIEYHNEMVNAMIYLLIVPDHFHTVIFT